MFRHKPSNIMFIVYNIHLIPKRFKGYALDIGLPIEINVAYLIKQMVPLLKF